MSRRYASVSLLACLSTVFVAAAAQAGVNPDTLDLARAAANSGDRARAIALYDELLQGSPDDAALLAESAQQLSWDGRYDEALRRYEQALALDPDNRFAALERAKVLSWSARYREAAIAFRELLALDPQDVEAQLGLARTLSWSGDQVGAREQYSALLRRQPELGEALLGLAQTHAWSGELDLARPLYERAAAAMQEPKDAELGLAYLDLWQGRFAASSAAASALAARYPGDKEVRELQRALRAATRPWLGAGWDQMDDTDRNLLTARRFEAGATLPNDVGIGLSYVDYDIRTAGERGSIDSLQLNARWTPHHRHRIEAMAGFDRWVRPGSPNRSVGDWGLAYHFPAGKDGEGWIAARREPYRYSVPLIDNRVVIDSFAAGLTHRAGRWILAGEANGWSLSDGNDRLGAEFSGRYRWMDGARKADAGLVLRWLDWRKDLDNGYFDPSNFISAGATARMYGPLRGGSPLDYDIGLEAGLQSFDFAGRRTRGDPYYLAVLRLGWQLTDSLRLEAFGEAGSYASQGSEDWRYSRAGARFLWRFGPAR